MKTPFPCSFCQTLVPRVSSPAPAERGERRLAAVGFGGKGEAAAARATGFDGEEHARGLELREASRIGGGKELDGSDSAHGRGSSA